MVTKQCCVENCYSCSTRGEDVGVTFHKFPKDVGLRELWLEVTRDFGPYVCSRHFCKSDFQSYKDSKYVLQSDAVPSIFPWTSNLATVSTNMEVAEEVGGGEPPSPQENPDPVEVKDTCLDDSKETEGENIEAIKRFIAEQEKEILELQAEVKPSTSNILEHDPKINDSFDLSKDNKMEKEDRVLRLDKDVTIDSAEETAMVASDVMNIILSESEAKLAKKKLGQKSPKADNNSSEKVKSGSMALSVGSRVEAKDFSELWYPAHIVEVDYDEMEVLVHYDNIANKHDEWINVSSPRLRPFDSAKVAPAPAASAAGNPVAVKEEPKLEERAKVTFAVGDRCLARWRDNRRFMATIHAELGNGKYEVVFDDGVHWTCGVSRLSKMRDAPAGARHSPLHVDTGGAAPPALPSPVPAVPPTPPYHTHLFDPARDYLGSKSERREMKRKLNIKEIFNIGQKKKKVDVPEKPQRKKAKVVKKKVAAPAGPPPAPADVKTEVKSELPDAVAAIIGTVQPEAEKLDAKEPDEKKPDVGAPEPEVSEHTLEVTVVDPNAVDDNTEDDDTTEDIKLEIKEESQDEVKPEEIEEDEPPSISDDVMDNISRTITKLEGDLIKVSSPKTEYKREKTDIGPEKDKKKSSKKSKKLRLKQEIKVKEEVQKVKCELETMKSELEEIKKRASLSLLKGRDRKRPAADALAAPGAGEWCCRWVNGQPVGAVSELDGDDGKGGLPRRSVQVEDSRLPEGWTKHMVRRSLGSSAGKWDVVLVSPDNKRLHTRTEMVKYLENRNDSTLKPFEPALLDFGMHRKLAKRLGWDSTAPDPAPSPPRTTVSNSSPIINSRKLSLKRKVEKMKMQKFAKKKKRAQANAYRTLAAMAANVGNTAELYEVPPLEDGYVYVGSLKVQIIENLLRCPAEGCFKNFRNNTLIKMHIKHYHRELRKELGATPKVSDLASSRAEVETDTPRLRFEPELKVPKLKISKKRLEEVHVEPAEIVAEPPPEETATTPPASLEPETPKILDSPKLRNALVAKVIKRPRVLLPVKKSEDLFPDMEGVEPIKEPERDLKLELDPVVSIAMEPTEVLDFESEISTYTVSKQSTASTDRRKKGEKKKTFASISKGKQSSEEEEWLANSDVETQLSFPRSGSPDSKFLEKSLGTPPPASSESTEDKAQHLYMYNEAGERIRIVHMKREEIINCHCGFREEDGLMIQCELCLCWQHALCHNIQKEAEVPEKYTCSICLNPRRGRRSQRFLHDQDRLYEGLLPGARPCDTLKRSHELSGNLLRIEDALHALKVKYHVATKKDHPKLYLWAKDWENELGVTADRLHTDYVDLGMMISAIGKENLPIKSDDVSSLPLSAMATPSSEDPESERYNHRDTSHFGSALLSGLLSSPGGASLDLPISTTDLERLAKSVQEAEIRTSVAAPQPEAAIENSACRERLLRHIQRCQALIDARLDSIEAQVAELESQDPSFEDDETADYFPRTKQTIQMMLRDLDAMEELGVIT